MPRGKSDTDASPGNAIDLRRSPGAGGGLTFVPGAASSPFSVDAAKTRHRPW
jgi:hypothetical protein